MRELVIVGASLVDLGVLVYLAGTGAPARAWRLVRRSVLARRPARRDSEWDTGVIRRAVIPAGAMVTRHRRRV